MCILGSVLESTLGNKTGKKAKFSYKAEWMRILAGKVIMVFLHCAKEFSKSLYVGACSGEGMTHGKMALGR